MKVRLPSPLPTFLVSIARKNTSLFTAELSQTRKPLRKPLNSSRRNLSTSSSLSANSQTPPPSPPNPAHFLSTTHARLGKCITWGLTPPQLDLCSQILTILTREWRFLVAGREGFVVRRAGLSGRRVIWGEMDSMGHVNNVMYVRYAETGRVEWLLGLGEGGNGSERERWAELMTPRGEKGVILKSIKVDYKFPMKWPDRMSVFHKLRVSPSSSADPSSFVLDVLIMSEAHQRPAARCEEDIVVYDYEAGKKAAITGFMKEGFEKAWREQEEERGRAEQRIGEVEEMVRKLEKDSWDREGAVEEMGAGKP